MTTPVEERPVLPVEPAPVAAEPPVVPPPSPQSLAAAAQIVSEGRAALEDATFEQLMGKPRRTLKFPVTLPDADGNPVVRQIRYRAMSPEDYDSLVAAHVPTQAHKDKGLIWNEDTFPPALIAAVSDSPKMTVEQAKSLYANPAWSAGERRELFYAALDVSAAGLNVPFNAGG